MGFKRINNNYNNNNNNNNNEEKKMFQFKNYEKYA